MNVGGPISAMTSAMPLEPREVLDDKLVERLCEELEQEKTFFDAVKTVCPANHNSFLRSFITELYLSKDSTSNVCCDIDGMMEHFPQETMIILKKCADVVLAEACESSVVPAEAYASLSDLDIINDRARLRSYLDCYNDYFKRVYLNWAYFQKTEQPLFYDNCEHQFFDYVREIYDFKKLPQNRYVSIELDFNKLPLKEIKTKPELLELLLLILSPYLNHKALASIADYKVFHSLPAHCRPLCIKVMDDMEATVNCVTTSIVVLPILGFMLAQWTGFCCNGQGQ
jgi:hypothetical protein